jgi:hypothetical protein
MIGFQHSRHADVNLITDNLRDRYKDLFSILKELAQNADDAGAGQLRFGIAPGNSEALHELLRGPGLVVVNDGVFRHSDYEAICSFGLNTKAGDVATIGKFGLGMKSVFHLSEAIFFIAEGEGGLYQELLSPWGKEFRPDWDLSEAQQGLLLESVRKDCLAAVGWNTEPTPFILYLPLRRKAHLQLPDGRLAGAIIEEYPGENGRIAELLRADDTGARLVSLLPLLRSLRSIQVYLPTGDGTPKLVFGGEMEPNASRPLRHHADGQSELASAIRIGTRRLRFAGWQRHAMTENLAEIHTSSAWPASWVRDELGRPYRALDKAQPHAAAVFGQENVPGALTIRWAVFLPIEEHEERIALNPGTGGYSLTLHGHFFVDAGRNGLYGLDPTEGEGLNEARDEAWVRRNWNRELAGRSTLDLVIPALDRFTRELGLSDERASALATAIGASDFWKRWRRQVAANQKWLRTVGRDGCAWKMMGMEATLPILQPPENDPGRPWRVFPELDSIFAHGVFFDSGARNLVANDNELGSWDEQQLSRLVSKVSAGEVFSSTVDAAYLAEFLERIPTVVRANHLVQAALCDLLRRAVRAKGLQGLRNVAERVRRIAALVSPERKLRIALRATGVAVAEFLVLVPAAMLAWPQDLDLGNADSNPAADTVEHLLRALAGKPDHAEACRQYAEELLKQVQGAERRKLLDRTGDLAILSAFDCQRGQKTSVSADRLRKLWERRALFRMGQGTTDRERAGLGTVLQAVLADEPILVVNRDLAELVFDHETAESFPGCDSRGVLRCLAHLPRRLADSRVRGELLRQIRLPDHDLAAVKGLRFLLHADPEHLDSDVPLWVEQGDGASAWRKIWQAVVPLAKRWTVVDPAIAAQLVPADWTAVKLKAISPEEVARLIAEVGTESLVSLGLDGTEHAAILGYERWDTNTWRSLPFHLTTRGQRVPIATGKAYLEQPGIILPKELLDRVDVIARSSDPRIASFQDQRILKLDYEAAILIAVSDDAPQLWCESILDWLSQVSLSAELIQRLSNTRWLRLKSGRAVKPVDFIILAEVEGHISPVAQYSKEFGTLSLLPDNLQEHSVFERLQEDLFPSAGSLTALTRMVATDATLAVGEPVIEIGDLLSTSSLLSHAPDRHGSRGWAITYAICIGYGVEPGAAVFRAMRRPIPLESVTAILQWLSDRCPEPGAAFPAYLRLLASMAPDRSVLQDLRLCAQDGSWKQATELCWNVSGVAKSALLSVDHAEPLEELLERTKGTTDQSELSSPWSGTQKSVEEHFQPWLKRGLRAQVGALLTLVSQPGPQADYAENLLYPHTREWFLKNIPFVSDGRHWREFADAIGKYCFAFFIVDENDKVPTVSLLGGPLQVPLDKTFRHLLVGRPRRFGPLRETRLCFRKIELARFSDAQLSRILRVTAEEILNVVYRRSLSLEIWNQLDNSGQFDIAMAERQILYYLPFYLGQLRLQNAELLEHLRSLDDDRRAVIEYKNRPEGDQKNRELDASRERLKDLLKHNIGIQGAVLEAVRAKVRDSYQPSSIPFELFQNADDAYVQLREVERASGIHSSGLTSRFVLVKTGDTVSFLHWGRPVNAIGPRTFDGRRRGYHLDLEKMLTLWSSEKQIALDNRAARVTGKFGLGFKSVFLACDRPRLVSGNLHVEIVGGVLPRALPEATTEVMRRQIEELGQAVSGPGTIVQLPKLPDGACEGILRDFLICSGYLTAFGLAIREITYIDETELSRTAIWNGRTVAGIKGLQCGTLLAEGFLKADTLSVLRISLSRGSVLFGLGPNGVQSLPKGTPAVWVTRPTREVEHFGFAVSAMFDVDPGRERLSGNDFGNVDLAERLGKELAEVLRALRNLDWDLLRRDLHLAPDTTDYEFWESIWSIFQQTAALADSAARRIMFRLLEVALAGISGDLKVVPNGLRGEPRTLTTGRSVHHRLAGVLTIDRCAAPLFGWSVWNQRSLGCEMVASARMAEALKYLGFKDLPSVNLATVASWLSHQTVRSNEAHILGELLKCLPDQNARNQEINSDLEKAKTALASVKFLSKAGTPERSGDLLAFVPKTDEGHRAAFAPDHRRLAEEYGESAVAFFRFCRGAMRTQPAELAQWARQAETAAARRAALEYLLEGEIALNMRKELRGLEVRGTWLANPADVAGVTPELLAELRQPPLGHPDQDQAPFILPPARNPSVTLAGIERWWAKNSSEQLRAYDARFYPNARPPKLAAPSESGFDRGEWMVLFGRAVFYRIGRSTDEQHRSFIERAQRTGSWSVFSAANPQERAHEWMNVLDRFWDEQVDSDTWGNWMRSFPQFYKLARWLEEYAELFLNLERQDSPYDLAAVLNSRTDQGQQGGGIDAPPPSLGIGACFVIRELLRYRHIRNNYAREHAFLPTGAVRRLINRIGLEIDNEASVEVSSQIYRQIAHHLNPERATFGGAYDIPFQLIAADPELEAQLLDGFPGATPRGEY